MVMALVPAYNEAKTIERVVRDLYMVADSVVVIDDASIDETARLAADAGAVVLQHSLNRGQGAALETGHVYARLNNADFVVHFDGDGQFFASDISRGLSLLKEKKLDIVLGTRAQKKDSIPFLKRTFIFPVARAVDKLFGSVSLTDAHNGFRVMNRTALEVLQLTQDRMAHASEIPQLIKKYNVRYAELPVSVSYHEFGQGFGGGLRVVRDLLIGKFI